MNREQNIATRALRLGFAVTKHRGPDGTDRFLLQSLDGVTLDELEGQVNKLAGAAATDFTKITHLDAALEPLSDREIVNRLRGHLWDVETIHEDGILVETPSGQLPLTSDGYVVINPGPGYAIFRRDLNLKGLRFFLAQLDFLNDLLPDDDLPGSPLVGGAS